MAKASMKQQARRLAQQGRKGDTELVHMSKDEIKHLTAMGTMTTNPKTGLKEAFKFSSLFSNPISLLIGGAALALGQPELLGLEAGTAAVGSEAALGELGINTALSASTLTGEAASLAGPAALGGAAAGATAGEIAATGAGTGIIGATGIGSGTASAISTGSNIVSGLKTAATILNPIMSLAGAAGGIQAAKNAASLTNQPTLAPPVVPPPITMPTGGNADTMNAMRANIQEQVVRRGRAATILTNPGEGDRLGS